MGVKSACKLRPEVLKGDLDDAIFAADFGDVVAGGAPPVYGNTEVTDPLMIPRPLTPMRREALIAYLRDALTDPRIQAEAPPLAGARAGSAATLVVGRTDPGVHAQPPRGDVANIATAVLPGTAASSGYASVQLDLAMQPVRVDTRLFARWYVADPAQSSGWAVTPAVRFRVFDRGDAAPVTPTQIGNRRGHRRRQGATRRQHHRAM